ncbi:hypothetical protein L9F63_004667, partial [Diploptera punctata]
EYLLHYFEVVSCLTSVSGFIKLTRLLNLYNNIVLKSSNVIYLLNQLVDFIFEIS